MTTVLSKRRIQYYNRDDHAIATAAATEDIISLADSPTSSSSSSVVHDTSTNIDVDLMNGNNNLNNSAVALPGGATRNNTNGRKNNWKDGQQQQRRRYNTCTSTIFYCSSSSPRRKINIIVLIWSLMSPFLLLCLSSWRITWIDDAEETKWPPSLSSFHTTISKITTNVNINATSTRIISNNNKHDHFDLPIDNISTNHHNHSHHSHNHHKVIPTSTSTSTSKTILNEKGGRVKSLTTKKTTTKTTLSSEKSSTTDSFSACILWMDDNHRLIEWIAYHYYTLKLRYLVVAVDSNSKTTPDEILQRWNGTTHRHNTNNTDIPQRMMILKWTDKDYMPDSVRSDHQRTNNSNSSSLSHSKIQVLGSRKTEQYKERQRWFYKKCTRHLQKRNRTWTAFVDVDEYITFRSSLFARKRLSPNRELRNDVYQNEARKKMERPGIIFETLQEMGKNRNKNRNNATISSSVGSPPSTGVAANTDTDTDIDAVDENVLSCIIVNRRQVVAKEDKEEEVQQQNEDSNNTNNSTISLSLPSYISNNTGNNDNIQLDTFRYNYLSPGGNGQPKSIINVGLKGPRNFNGAWQPHFLMSELCRREEKTRSRRAKHAVTDTNLEILHYLGSWQSYSYRDNDARKGSHIKNRQVWIETSDKTNGEKSSVIHPWLHGFTKLVGGEENAKYLLKDAGYIPSDHTNVAHNEEDHLQEWAPQYYADPMLA